jgi:hypothetical protein
MMRRILMILLTLTLTFSCASHQNIDGETHKVFKSIVKEQYVLHKNDCSNKASKFLNYLVSRGQEADIAVFGTNQPNMLHAVVYSEGTYYCLTSGMITRNPRTISKYVTRGLYLFSIKKEELNKVIVKVLPDGRIVKLHPKEWEYK